MSILVGMEPWDVFDSHMKLKLIDQVFEQNIYIIIVRSRRVIGNL